ncbi:hypothetical protein SAMN04488498_103122 [Mesorhizobium albiziae]|uniref:Uncharacterized protein n=1 Tax=Neomesorhizobium albiziae TaxID=335020 RepID=A0A1I3XBN8_9HYPH|nr:hypothetical protein [Mesorhizobium albiziae]GLS30561.1 hypothetical protein GCM10007937_22690 [Mesorhizobium albiziae]SFK17008.1 hypothetical protein SAMN04488498_103122 [Mesorhizobium albiziae]
MKSDYTPKFPRSISAGDYRLPLDHPDVEAVGRRADRLYQTAPLSDDERGLLIKKYAGLEDADRFLSGWLHDRLLPETNLRPQRPWSGGGVVGAVTEHHVGFVARAREYIEKLERRHPATIADPEMHDRPVLVDDDLVEEYSNLGDLEGQPGDDI